MHTLHLNYKTRNTVLDFIFVFFVMCKNGYSLPFTQLFLLFIKHEAPTSRKDNCRGQTLSCMKMSC